MVLLGGHLPAAEAGAHIFYGEGRLRMGGANGGLAKEGGVREIRCAHMRRVISL